LVRSNCLGQDLIQKSSFRGQEALQRELAVRDARWSEAIAVGSLAFAETVKTDLGIKAMHREVEQAGGAYTLRESSEAYGGEFAYENELLRLDNTIPWQKFLDTAVT
jgi:hypothetical protein